MKIILTEKQIQDTLVGYLRMRGYYVSRMNSGKYSVGEGGQRRFIMGHEAGTPDLMAFKQSPLEITCYRCETKYAIEPKPTGLLFIEVKRPGKKPTLLQKTKMEELRRFGAKCYVATSVEDLQEAGI